MVAVIEERLERDAQTSTNTTARRGLLGLVLGAARRVLLSEYFVLYLAVGYFLALSVFFPSLTEPRNLSNQLLNVWPLLAVAIGQTFVLIVAGIDLSQGAIMAITSVVGGILMTNALDPNLFQGGPLWGTVLSPDGGPLANHPQAVLVAVLVMLALGAFIGFLNGVAITRFNMPPFMVTLVALTFFSAFALWLTQSRNIINVPDEFIRLGNGDIVSIYLGEKLTPDIRRRDILPFITYPAVISVGLLIAAHLILSRTVFGRHMYAVGANRRAAKLSGVPTQRVIIFVYMFSGFCAAVASILYSARLGGGRPTLGVEGKLLLDIIAATVIGGASFAGGKGKVTWTFFGVIFFTLLLNTLNAMRLSAFHIDMVKGVVILIAALLDVTRTRLMAREHHA